MENNCNCSLVNKNNLLEKLMETNKNNNKNDKSSKNKEDFDNYLRYVLGFFGLILFLSLYLRYKKSRESE